MTPQPTITIPATEYEDMKRRLAKLELVVDRYLMKRREIAFIEAGHIEDERGMERTKKSRKEPLR